MKAILVIALMAFAVSCQEVSDKSREQPPIKQEVLQLTPQNDFSGTYNVVNDSTTTETCDFSIILKQEATGYSYELMTDKRDVKGNASFQQEDEGALLTLEGITWDEYEGDTSNEETANTEQELPVGVAIMVKNDTIHIQNSGNVMNSYTVFTECGKKYIVLAKQKKVK